jgi:hypothetical protein
MKLRALVSFSGVVSAHAGMEFETSKAVGDDLIQADYAELVAKSGGSGSEGGNAPATTTKEKPQVDQKAEDKVEAPASSSVENKSGAEVKGK